MRERLRPLPLKIKFSSGTRFLFEEPAITMRASAAVSLSETIKGIGRLGVLRVVL